jgi:hypothetical protein
MRAGCAERHADANLVRAPTYNVRHKAVNADRRKENGKQSEECTELSDEALIGETAGDLFIERGDTSDGETAVD